MNVGTGLFFSGVQSNVGFTYMSFGIVSEGVWRGRDLKSNIRTMELNHINSTRAMDKFHFDPRSVQEHAVAMIIWQLFDKIEPAAERFLK
ncbi:hypothetical protein AVEN_108109-1 [Araneus ventricosus]|uniref:Uncharacterized protein n=1 Tax=Araneus ventricosus TaxID=182803 RepID=A0A4Y2H235_ARAVE|nr:hypothetical protein AVEN_108109-1 [Araneus ventricosus]